MSSDVMTNTEAAASDRLSLRRDTDEIWMFINSSMSRLARSIEKPSSWASTAAGSSDRDSREKPSGDR